MLCPSVWCKCCAWVSLLQHVGVFPESWQQFYGGWEVQNYKCKTYFHMSLHRITLPQHIYHFQNKFTFQNAFQRNAKHSDEHWCKFTRCEKLRGRGRLRFGFVPQVIIGEGHFQLRKLTVNRDGEWPSSFLSFLWRTQKPINTVLNCVWLQFVSLLVNFYQCL